MITGRQLRAYEGLRLAGASHLEAAQALRAAADVEGSIELARRSVAWMHERRGRGGQWTGGAPGPARLSDADREAASMGVNSQNAMVSKVMRRQARMNALKDRQVAESDLKQEASLVAHAQALQVHEEKAKEDLAKVMGQVKELQAKADAEADTIDGQKHKTAFFSHMAFIVAGGVIAAAEAKLGPTGMGGILTQTSTMITAGFGQELVDLAKKL
jgi:hypothetical protein